MAKVLWFPVGLLCTGVYRAANRLFGATRFHCMLGFWILNIVHLASGFAWNWPHVNFTDGMYLAFIPLNTIILKRNAENFMSSDALAEGKFAADPRLWFFRLMVALLLGYAIGWMAVTGQTTASVWFWLAHGVMLIDGDDGPGRPVVARLWDRVKALTARVSPVGVTG